MWITRRTLALTMALPLIVVAASVYTVAAGDENPPPSKGGARGGIESANGAEESAADALDKTVQNTSKRPDVENTVARYTIRPDAIKEIQPYVAGNARRLGLWGYEWADDYKWIRITANEENQTRFRKILEEKDWVTAIQSNDKAEDDLFLSLEEQRIADRAYAILGMELEPASAEELGIAKGFGYAGGLRITGGLPDASQTWTDDDILVGLHSWPITDLKSLDAVLSRDDLAKLSPLKYYVVGLRDFGRGGRRYEVVTGRVQFDRNHDPLAVESHENQFERDQAVKKVSWLTSLDQAKAHAEKAGKPLLLYFESADSSACRSFEHDVLSHPEVQSLIAKRFVAVSIDVDKFAKIAEAYNVRRIPNLTVATLRGDSVGFINPSNWTSVRDSLINGHLAARMGVQKDAARSEANVAPEAGHKASQQPQADRGAKTLEPGDEVKIEVVGDIPEAPIDGVFVIEPQGTVALGATYGRVKIAGLSLLEAERAVAEKLKGILTNVQVQITLPLNALRRDHAAQNSQRGAPSPTLALAPFTVTVMQRASHAGGMTTAYLRIKMAWPDLVTPQEIEQASMNQLALAKSAAVIGRALSSPNVNQLQSVQRKDAEAWLSERLKVSFPGDGEIMELRLLAEDNVSAAEDIALLNAIVEAYAVWSADKTPADDHAEPTVVPTPTPPAFSDEEEETYRRTGRMPPPKPVYLYDGKTFHEWRSLWQHELKTERRIEAINALAAFAQAGKGREAAEAILDVAGEYSFERIDSGPEGKLKTAIIDVLVGDYSRVNQADWLPALAERMEADPQKWRMLSYWVLTRPGTYLNKLSPEVRDLLMKWASDEKYGPNSMWLVPLLQTTPEPSDPLKQLVRKSLAGKDTENVLNLLRVTRFNKLNEAPEQFDLLFHPEAEMRRAARTILLEYVGVVAKRAVFERAVQILEDANRAADHADAVRTLGALMISNPWPDSSEATIEASNALKKTIGSRLLEIVKTGDASLLPAATAALLGLRGDVETLASQLEEQETLPAERLEQLKQASLEGELDRMIDTASGALNRGGGGFGGEMGMGSMMGGEGAMAAPGGGVF